MHRSNEDTRQPTHSSLLTVAAAMLANLVIVFGAMFAAEKRDESPWPLFGILAGIVFAVFAITLFFTLGFSDSWWKRLVLVVGGSFILTLLFGILVGLISFSLIGLFPRSTL